MARQKTEDELDDDALALLLSPAADRFALALDRMGWMIVRQPGLDGRWFMQKPPKRCPDWADPECPRDKPGTTWGLAEDGKTFIEYAPEPWRVIEGSKEDGLQHPDSDPLGT
jgi:hypothetical protein